MQLQATTLTAAQPALIDGVLAEVATAPQPVLVIDGHTAVITNVRFSHSDHCTYCRKYIHGWSDGGTIRMGIELVGKKQEPRWFGHYKSGSRPTSPATCPHCGQDPRLSFRKFGLPVASAQPLEQEVFTHIWANFGDIAEQAQQRSLGPSVYGANFTYDGQRA